MLKSGRYTVDEENNKVYSNGEPIHVRPDKGGYLWVNLYKGDRRRAVFIHQLVYWKHTGKCIPRGYQIDHDDGDNRNNRWSNLELMTKEEHFLKHAESVEGDPWAEDDEVPF